MSHELLTETLASVDEATNAHTWATSSTSTRWAGAWSMNYAPTSIDLPPAELAEHVIGGLTKKDVDLDWDQLTRKSALAAVVEDESFILPPLPNTLFTRDSSCWIYNGVSINPMYYPARRLEVDQH